MPTRPIAADKLRQEVAQLRPVQLDLRTRIAPMSIAGSRRKLRALPASGIATQNQPLLLPAQALRAMCSITLVMENRCSLSSAIQLETFERRRGGHFSWRSILKSGRSPKVNDRLSDSCQSHTRNRDGA